MLFITKNIINIYRELKRIAYLLFYLVFEKKSSIAKQRKVLFFGCPIINITNTVNACKLIAEKATTFVPHVYSISKKSDFDYVSTDINLFFKQLKEHNIYLNYFDSIDLLLGPISKYLFAYYIKNKRKKLIVMPYGADALILSRISNYLTKHALNIEYHFYGLKDDELIKRYNWINKIADFRVGVLFCNWDILPVSFANTNIENLLKIKNEKYPIFTIIHTPNHRGCKGTEFLIEAVKQLKEEGFTLELKLVEKVPNMQILEELSKSHLLVEQLIMGYGYSAIEGMGLGLPVISNLNPEFVELFDTYSYLKECPIVRTSLNIEDIKQKILYVMDHQEELSKKSLEYAQKYHSYEAAAVMWNKIFDCLRTDQRPINYFHPIIGKYSKDYENYINKLKQQSTKEPSI